MLSYRLVLCPFEQPIRYAGSGPIPALACVIILPEYLTWHVSPFCLLPPPKDDDTPNCGPICFPYHHWTLHRGRVFFEVEYGGLI